MTRYLYHPTESFREKLGRIEKADPPGYLRIRSVIERLLENPADADGKMHGGHRGILKKYVGRSEYRILYHWCELCRKANQRQRMHCPDCAEIPNESVVFFDVYHKNEARRIKRAGT